MSSTEENELNEILGMSAKELDDLGMAYDNDRIVSTNEDRVFEGTPSDYLH